MLVDSDIHDNTIIYAASTDVWFMRQHFVLYTEEFTNESLYILYNSTICLLLTN